MIRLFVFVFFLPACALSLRLPRRVGAPPASDPANCAALDRNVLGWTGVSIASGILSGGGGLTSLLTDDNVARYAVGGVGLGLAVVVGVSSYLSTSYSQRYVQECTVNTSNAGGK